MPTLLVDLSLRIRDKKKKAGGAKAPPAFVICLFATDFFWFFSNFTGEEGPRIQ